MSTTPAPDSPSANPEGANPYELYYLEQAALLSSEQGAPAGRTSRRDLESFRLSPISRGVDGEPRPLRRQDVVLVILSVVILLVVPLIIATVYWRMSALGS